MTGFFIEFRLVRQFLLFETCWILWLYNNFPNNLYNLQLQWKVVRLGAWRRQIREFVPSWHTKLAGPLISYHRPGFYHPCMCPVMHVLMWWPNLSFCLFQALLIFFDICNYFFYFSTFQWKYFDFLTPYPPLYPPFVMEWPNVQARHDKQMFIIFCQTTL